MVGHSHQRRYTCAFMFFFLVIQFALISNHCFYLQVLLNIVCRFFHCSLGLFCRFWRQNPNLLCAEGFNNASFPLLYFLSLAIRYCLQQCIFCLCSYLAQFQFVALFKSYLHFVFYCFLRVGTYPCALQAQGSHSSPCSREKSLLQGFIP